LTEEIIFLCKRSEKPIKIYYRRQNMELSKSLNETPDSERIHIGFYGKRNSGKSSLLNALTGQNVAIVSDVAGTTTDPVKKAMEIHGLGPCVLVDTAGFDDDGKLGSSRVEKTELAAEKTDIAVVVFTDDDFAQELEWVNFFKSNKTPVLAVVNKSDINAQAQDLAEKISKKTDVDAVTVSAVTKDGIDAMRQSLIRLLPEDYTDRTITGDLCRQGDTVMLVMPQDIQAPKGRLILPQVQTTRELLDKKCILISVTTDELEQGLASLKDPPDLIITDSQAFARVWELKPESSKLTSFSALFAGYKGDINEYVKGAAAIDRLTGRSKVLIAECCTHAPLKEDIGREKLPRMLRAKAGQDLTVDICSGTDYPQDLSGYDLIIQCGACMFNRKYVMTRIQRAVSQNVPITNYGIVLAYLSGILDKIVLTD
jgi:[FeFe] hydrogenase H-cluster maturation GTPase HydF